MKYFSGVLSNRISNKLKSGPAARMSTKSRTVCELSNKQLFLVMNTTSQIHLISMQSSQNLCIKIVFNIISGVLVCSLEDTAKIKLWRETFIQIQMESASEETYFHFHCLLSTRFMKVYSVYMYM